MEVLVAADSLFFKCDDGSYWCKTIYGYDFWTRYTQVFSSVAIVSRTKHVSKEYVKGYLRVDGPNVRIVELPCMRGMKQYILSYFTFRAAARSAVEQSDIAIFRLPSVAAFMVLNFYKKRKKPYGLEVVADPQDAYRTNRIAQLVYTRKMKREVYAANGVSYVTQFYLQSQYPSRVNDTSNKSKYFETYYSTIDLKNDYFNNPKKFMKGKTKYTLVHIANSINNDMKGHTTVLKVIKELRLKGLDFQVKFIGDGDKKEYFSKYAKELQIEEYVEFTGLLRTPKDVRKELIDSDIFLFPTRAEGLPRAVIEAMAVGLPCLSTPVNGIPELLDEEYLFNPDDVDGFVNKLVEITENTQLLEQMSEKNIIKAKEYSIDKLSRRRNIFYNKLLELSSVK